MSMKMIGTVSTEAKLESFRSRNNSKMTSVKRKCENCPQEEEKETPAIQF